MAKEIETGTTSQVLGEIINKGFVAQIIQEIDALINEDQNNQFLQDKLERMKALLQDMSTAFEHQNTGAPSESIEYCLKRMREAIQKAKALIDAQSQPQKRSRYSILNAPIDAQSQPEEGSSSSISNALIDAQSQPQQWGRYSISNLLNAENIRKFNAELDKPFQDLKIPREISKLNAELDQLFQDLKNAFDMVANARLAMMPLQSPAWPQSSASAPPQETDVLLKPMTEAGLSGPRSIESAETRLQIVLTTPLQSSAMPQSYETQLQIVPATAPQSSLMPQSSETQIRIVPATPPQSSAMPQFYETQHQIVPATPLQSSAMPQSYETQVQIVGRAIRSAETQLKTWIETPRVQVIAVYGMPGVGKTTLLDRVYKFYKHTNVFDSVIWVTVSRIYEIRDLQGHIAKKLELNLSGISESDADTAKRMLSESLIEKKFLLILDDIWSALDLKQLGVAFGTDKGSKVVFSTRHRDLALSEADESINVESLSKDEGWELFARVAFKGGHVPEELQECARKIADECESLPLAITVVASVMRGKGTKVDDWNSCLFLMKNADRSFADTHPSVDHLLYQRIRWSYDDLPTNLQNCFLYCALFPEDEQIWVDELVRMWIAEGFCKSNDRTYSMDVAIGYSYVKLLIDRGLFQSGNFGKQAMDKIVIKPVNVWKKRFITVHDVIRDMAIYIAEGEQDKKHLCRAGVQLKCFPRNPTQDCKRMSLRRNQIESVPEDFPCKQLVSLILSQNPLVCNVRGSFLKNLSSLRVLDLSNTQIESVPTSLTQLRLLDLSNTQIKSVPTSFTELQFLTLRSTCIKELPREIGNLSDLQFLDISECKYLTSLPTEISQLTSLKRLHLSMGMENAVKDPTNIMALRGLKHLIEFHLYMFFKFENHEIMGTIMGSWVEMRHLYLHYNHMIPSKSNLPEEMQNMKNLETLVLYDYRGTRLPNWVCEFQQLQRLEMDSCGNVKELPPLERLPRLKFLKLRKYTDVRNLGIRSGFPELEILHLSDMTKLRSIGVFEEGPLPKLHVLKINKCPQLKKLPIGMDKLPNLRALYGHRISWWERLTWEDHNMKICLQKLFKEI